MKFEIAPIVDVHGKLLEAVFGLRAFAVAVRPPKTVHAHPEQATLWTKIKSNMTFMSIPVIEDVGLSDTVLEFRDADGFVVSKIVNLGKIIFEDVGIVKER